MFIPYHIIQWRNFYTATIVFNSVYVRDYSLVLNIRILRNQLKLFYNKLYAYIHQGTT